MLKVYVQSMVPMYSASLKVIKNKRSEVFVDFFCD